MIVAPEIHWLDVKATLIARFGVDLYVANRAVKAQRNIEMAQPNVDMCTITGDSVRFACDCGEHFTLDLLTTGATLTQWARAAEGDTRPSENHLIYARTDLSLPPCRHWFRIER